MGAPRDLGNMTFGKLCVVPNTRGVAKGNRSTWLCRCECGREKVMKAQLLLAGKARSCGCMKSRKGMNATHGMQGTPTWRSWQSMKTRCRDPSHTSYPRYGGRGISYDPKWESFEGFLEDMGMRPPGKTLDREDNDGDYNRANCRWRTPRQQSLNRSDNVWLTFGGETLCLSDMAAKHGLHRGTVHARLQRGWTLDRALTTPARR